LENNKIIEACKIYKSRLRFYDNKEFKHIKWMVEQISIFIEEKRKEKANRWLGFLWNKGLYTIEEMKEHNKE